MTATGVPGSAAHRSACIFFANDRTTNAISEKYNNENKYIYFLQRCVCIIFCFLALHPSPFTSPSNFCGTLSLSLSARLFTLAFLLLPTLSPWL